jgi:gamma-glutamyl hydrolase
MAYPVTGSELKYGKYYIAASYVKYIESAGGRVVPILYDSPQSELLTLFNQVNGVLFPGGAADIAVNSPLYNTAKYIVNLAMEAQEKGDYFPIEGHCLGFELLNIVVAENNSVLDRFDSDNLSLPLIFYDALKQSRIFSKADPEIINILSQQAVTMNNHVEGVNTATYNTNQRLSSFFSGLFLGIMIEIKNLLYLRLKASIILFMLINGIQRKFLLNGQQLKVLIIPRIPLKRMSTWLNSFFRK